MNTSKTYAVGLLGQVKRSYDLGDTWENVPIVISGIPNTHGLTDVEVTPTGGTVIVTGIYDDSIETPYTGIYYSTDDGDTWNTAGGDYVSVLERGFIWYEVSIVTDKVMYVCGTEGWVAKSTDGGLTFNLCTQIDGLFATYADREAMKESTLDAHSIHFLSTTVGVVGLRNNTVLTLNGGTNWIKCCGGNGIENPALGLGNSGSWMGGVQCHYENSVLVITALSYNYIFRSIDGGLTYSTVHTFNKPVGQSVGGYHLTWTDDLTLWGFGLYSQVIKSTDGGATWSNKQGYNPVGDQHISGHFYSGESGFYGSCYATAYLLGGILETTDGAQSGLQSEAFPPTPTAIWTWLGTPTCYLLTPCEQGLESIVVADDLSHIRGIIEICVPEVEPVTYPSEGLAYILSDCCGELPDQKVRLGTAQWYEYEVVYLPNFHNRCWRTGKVQQADSTYVGINTDGAIAFGTQSESCLTCINRFPCPKPTPPPGCTCYTVTISESCDNAIYLDRDWTVTEYQDCTECQGTCYLLTSECGEGTVTAVVTGEGIKQGDIIKVEGSNRCWLVSETDDCEHAVPIGNFTEYVDCDACVGELIASTPPLNIRLVKPGYDTPGCDPVYTEKINCKFANAVYNQMATVRYGIKMCCDSNLQQWNIKKQLLDLKAIYDPYACADPEDPDCDEC